MINVPYKRVESVQIPQGTFKQSPEPATPL